jgi:SAM-dependent methyltransferase
MITTWSPGVADDHMDEAILLELAGRVERHPWWRARAELTLALLDRLGVRPPSRVLDAGCGWGTTLAALEGRGYRAEGLDIARRALERLDRPDRTLIEADLTAPLPLAGFEPYDAVLALDVLEHLDDDQAAASRLGALARPGGGVVIVSVPARPDLFSEFDEVQGHRRRYEPDGLRTMLAGAGLAVDRVFWWGSWMVPVLRRRVGRRRAEHGEPPALTYARYLELPPWPGRLALKLAFALERGRALAGVLRTGTSLFAVARPIAGA